MPEQRAVCALSNCEEPRHLTTSTCYAHWLDRARCPVDEHYPEQVRERLDQPEWLSRRSGGEGG